MYNKSLKVGDRYNSIMILRHVNTDLEQYEQYNDCVITHVYKGKYAGSYVTLFNFTTNDGNLIMGCSLFDALII